MTADAFAVASTQASETVILTCNGPYVIRHEHGMTVQDVITLTGHCFDIRCTHAVGLLGERHPNLMIVPDAVIALEVDPMTSSH